MKNVLKTSLVAGSLLAFGFAVMSGVNPANTVSADATSGANAQVILTVEPGTITIGIDDTNFSNASGENVLDLGVWMVSNEVQTATGDFGDDGFWLDDQKGSESGYYTTLSVSDLTGVNNADHVIPATGIKLKSTSLHVMSGVQGDADISLSNSVFVAADSAVTYFERAAGTGGYLGKFGDKLNIEVTIPAHTVKDTYRGTITYTLFDEQQDS